VLAPSWNPARVAGLAARDGVNPARAQLIPVAGTEARCREPGLRPATAPGGRCRAEAYARTRAVAAGPGTAGRGAAAAGPATKLIARVAHRAAGTSAAGTSAAGTSAAGTSAAGTSAAGIGPAGISVTGIVLHPLVAGARSPAGP
jgi:hypothetical protein